MQEIKSLLILYAGRLLGSICLQLGVTDLLIQVICWSNVDPVTLKEQV